MRLQVIREDQAVKSLDRSKEGIENYDWSFDIFFFSSA